MASFLSDQTDYILFIYGLAFVTLAPICHRLSRQGRQLLPWLQLGLFGAIHGFN